MGTNVLSVKRRTTSPPDPSPCEARGELGSWSCSGDPLRMDLLAATLAVLCRYKRGLLA
jgi:hypothetical protein